MKQLIIQNYSSNNSIYKQSLLKILALTMLILFPIFLLLLFNFNKFQDKKTLEKRDAVELIIKSSLISSSKYGDLIYARAQSLELGKALGLLDLGICVKDQDIFERPHELRCKNTISNLEEISINSAPLDNQDYRLEFHWKKENQSLIQQAIFSFVLSFVMALFLFLPLQIFLLNFILTRVKDTMTLLIEDKIKTDHSSNSKNSTNNFQIPKEFEALSNFIQTKTNDLKIATKDLAIMDMAKQVSHDIRSPLTALMMALEDIDKNLPKSHLAIINSSVRRINDIANNLLNSSAGTNKQSDATVELMAPILDSLISEKRMQYRDNLKIDINFDLIGSYGLFAKVNVVELKRLLSNLINNSIEAITSSGQVSIKINETNENKVCINIIDNGHGMSEQVLSNLGEKGFTFGKVGATSGSGLGLFHAKKVIESYGGSIKITSTLNEGTSVKILLNKSLEPSWYVKGLIIPSSKKILILDDDESILHAWSERLMVTPDVFTSGSEFTKTVKTLGQNEFMAFIDFELLGQSQNGIDIIKSLNIAHNSFLVTSRYDEKELQDQCLQIGLKIIPKMMVAAIPIDYTDNFEEIYEYIYIDDDELLRISWEARAIKQNIKLLTLNTTMDFELYESKMDKNLSKIYIDNELGENQIKGAEFATTLHKNGYKNLFIASGYAQEVFLHMPWLKYAGKKCPF